jgi:preprotein translocase subunit SecA
VGTVSVEHSEKLSGLLGRRGVKHEVLNAKNHAREAEIVALAGAKGSVTVSTNMAGRGTDIKLGGNFEFRLKQALDRAALVEGDPEHLDDVTPIRDGLREECDADETSVLDLGGLYVLGTERHEARRIDNQLRGRSGRQGDVGTSRFYLSLQDKLMRRFYKEWVTNAMKRMGMEEGVPIESPMVTRAIERAQRKVEEYNFEIRKSLLEYDEVMDLQRKMIYGVRQEVLEDIELREKVTSMLGNIVRRQAAIFEGDADGFCEWFRKSFGFGLEKDKARVATIEREGNPQDAVDAVLARYDEREKEVGEELQRKVDRHLLLHAIDTKWMDHLRAIDALRQGIGLRGYGQKDPKNEYKAEGAKLFDKLFEVIEEEVTSLSLRVQVRAHGEGDSEGAGGPWMGSPATPYGRSPSGGVSTPQELKKAQALMRARQATRRAPASAAFDSVHRQKLPTATENAPARETAFSAGRNEPCPCGSGRKYKKCHGKG